MLKPFQFPDNSERLFGRKKDVSYLLERVRKPGITFITARPRMGKTWLLHEVGRQLAASDDCLIGYFEAKGGTELIQRAVIDLYLRWISTTTFSEQARILWEQNRGPVLPRVEKALGKAFEKIGELPLGGIEKIAGFFADGLNSLAVAHEDVKTGKIQYEPLPYEIVQNVLFLVDKIDNKGRNLVLFLDAWDQSDAITREKRTIEAIAKNIDDIEVWSYCHLLVAVRHPEMDELGTSPAYEAASQISNYDTAQLYELKLMEMNEQEKQQRFNLVDKIPILNELPLERIDELHHGYPGVIERWQKRADEIFSQKDLQRFAQEAWALEYSEFDKLFPSLEGDELRWAIRIAFFQPLNSDSWKIHQDILSEGIDENLWTNLFHRGILELEIKESPDSADFFPSYGHETRHHHARLWFLENRRKFGPDISVDITGLCFALAVKVQELDTDLFPFGIALLEYLSKELKPIVSKEAYALSYSAAILFGISLEYFDLCSTINRLIKHDPRTEVLILNALINQGITYGDKGDKEVAIANFTKVIEMPNALAQLRSLAMLLRGVALRQQGDTEAAIADYTNIIVMCKATDELLTQALLGRGVAYIQRGDTEAALADLTKVIKTPEAPPEPRAQALVNRGIAYMQQGDDEAAIKDITKVFEMLDAPSEDRAAAMGIRGAIFSQQGNNEAAISDYSKVIEMTEVPVQQRATAMVHRGVAYEQQGDNEAEIADYTKVIEMPEAPAEQRAKAMVNRGITYGQQGDNEAEIADYTKVIDMPEAPAEHRAKALVYRGTTYGQQGDSEAEIADYTKVFEMPEAPAEQRASAYLNRGVTYGQRGDSEAAIADFIKVIEMPEITVEQRIRASFGRGLALIQQSKREEGCKNLKSALELCEKNNLEELKTKTNKALKEFCQGRSKKSTKPRKRKKKIGR